MIYRPHIQASICRHCDYRPGVLALAQQLYALYANRMARTIVDGAILLMLSLVWTVVAQGQMGHSWRIGIDEEHQTSLIDKGLFSVSRNPIFLGMIIQIQGLEEAFLGRVNGSHYEEHRRNVRRWL
jgi:protein-S-isoprenylcysteine O-methyltransferase Ste14